MHQYDVQVEDILNPEGFLNLIIGSEITVVLPYKANRLYRQDINFCLGKPKPQGEYSVSACCAIYPNLFFEENQPTLNSGGVSRGRVCDQLDYPA